METWNLYRNPWVSGMTLPWIHNHVAKDEEGPRHNLGYSRSIDKESSFLSCIRKLVYGEVGSNLREGDCQNSWSALINRVRMRQLIYL